jgi:hypothetical protein
MADNVSDTLRCVTNDCEYYSLGVDGRSQWPRGLKRRSTAAWLLGSRVRIPLRAWMFVSCVSMLCCCPVQVEVYETG